MDASYECGDRIPFRGRDVAKIDRFKQGDIALLSVLPSLQAQWLTQMDWVCAFSAPVW